MPEPTTLKALVARLEGEARGLAHQPETQDFFRRTWSRLSADRRLVQSREALPDNAGPLNSQHLVHRALARMRELSPAYFERFGAYLDDLMWIEGANGAREEAAVLASSSRKGPRTRK